MTIIHLFKSSLAFGAPSDQNYHRFPFRFFLYFSIYLFIFQKSNSCWICKKLIDNDEEKVRDHCHVTGKFRGAAHWNCNINFQLTRKVPLIFHNLRGYDSHFELDKVDIKLM